MTPDELKKYESAYYDYNAKNPSKSYATLNEFATAQKSSSNPASSGMTTGGVPLYTDPTTGVSSSKPVQRYTAPTPASKVSDYYNGLDTTAPTADEEVNIKENIRKSMQDRIDAINLQYDNLLRSNMNRQEGALGETRAIAARGGLIGSDFGKAQKDKVIQQGKSVEDAYNEERNLKLNEIFNNIDTLAEQKIEAKKQEALGNQKTYIDYLENQQTNAINNLTEMGKLNLDYDKLATEDKQKLLDTTGLSEWEVKLKINANKPKASQIDWKSEKLADGQILLWGQDPTTGEIKQQKIQADIKPAEEWKEVDGVAYGVTKDANGNLVLRKLTEKSKSGGGDNNSSDRQNIQADMNIIKGSDGYYDTSKYAQIRESIAVYSPKVLSWFDTTYKPQDVLNPNDPTAKKYFQTPAQQVGTGGNLFD